LGILPGLIGIVQATETVKLLWSRPPLTADSASTTLSTELREMKVRKNPKCPICGPDPTITADRLPAVCGVPVVDPVATTLRRVTRSPAELKGMQIG